MRIAFYYPWIYLTSGGERVIAEMVRRSRHDWVLFTSHFEPQNTFPELRDRAVVELNPVSVKRDMASVARSAFTIARQKLPIRDYDALFVLCEGLGDLILARNADRPALAYCLTPLRAAFDPVYREEAARKRGLAGRLALRMGLGMFRAVDRLAWKRYARVLFVSRESAERARAGALPGAEEGEVLYPGVGVTREGGAGTFGSYFLIAGRIMWTKNLQLGIRAFQNFRQRCQEYRHFGLKIAGQVDEKSRPYLEELQASAGADPAIEFFVSPSDAELRRLYEHCYAVLFTPLNEDFGIVPIESMAFGKPVIAVNRGGPLETVEHGITGFLSPPEPDAFAGYMAALVGDPEAARRMGRAGIVHSRRFSWDHFVGRVDDLLEEIAGNPANRPATVLGSP